MNKNDYGDNMQSFWIWLDKDNKQDEFADFVDFFDSDGSGKYTAEISASGDYIMYVNGKLASFGQYRDYPHYKVKDMLDITDFVKNGKNTVKIIAWHTGVKCFTFATEKSGVRYEIKKNGSTVAVSDEKTLCRKDKGYISGKCESITPQLGLNYHYDASAEDEWISSDGAGGFATATVVDGYGDCIDRPVKKLVTLPLLEGKKVGDGEFKYVTDTQRLSVKMTEAVMAEKVENADGKYYVYDLGKEECGYLYLDINAKEVAKIDVSYGERLENGRVPASIDMRNFTLDYTAKKGKQTFVGYFRRLGLRYLQLNVHGEAKINVCGILPVRYPMKKKELNTDDALRKKIYDVACHTLELCVHEYYEDCPWREQCSYNTDSRLQMLYDYYAFGEYGMARATLELMSRGVRKDGFMPLCYPSSLDLPIPSFSLAFFEQVYEYLYYSKDEEFVKGKLPLLTNLAEKFIERLDGGVLNKFGGEFWNFYEWKDTLDGTDKTDKGGEATLTLLFSYALGYFIKTLEYLGKDATRYVSIRSSLNENIYSVFYDKERKLFKTFGNDAYNGKASVLVNSLAVLCRIKGSDGKEITELIKENKDSETTVGTSLSMNMFRFDAILSATGDKEFVLSEIDKLYSKMLDEGATTFWETELGYKDFGNAGSLCHGWSALPVYYYRKLL